MDRSNEPEFCYLKTTKNSFNKFTISIEGSVINFLICSDTTEELVLQLSTNIKQAHIQIGSTESYASTRTIYYSLKLILPCSKLGFIYFDSESARQRWYLKLLRKQGFKNRID